MSEIGQGHQEHHPSRESSLNNPLSANSSTAVPFVDDRPPPNRNPRLGELFVDVPLDAGLLKGGIAPHKINYLWCKYLVGFVLELTYIPRSVGRIAPLF